MRFGFRSWRAPEGVSALAALIACSLLAGAGGTGLRAQNGGRQPLDGVVGVIGDRVILASTIERELEQQPIEGDAIQRQRARDAILIDIAREEVWVQIGKVIGREDPEAFEQQIRQLLDEYKREQVDRYGSFTRMSQELEALGRTWQSLEDEQRNRILGDSARQQAIRQRFSEGLHLLVTPREMAEFYRTNAAQFAARDSADLAWISFPRTEPGAEQRAADAAAAWRVEDIGERDLAGRFGGVALRPNLDVRPTAEDRHAAFLKDFARDGAEGDVLGPVVRGSSLFVVKMIRKQSQPAMAFEDPAVQDAIRQSLVRQRISSLELGVLNWKAREILRIPPDILSPR
jgi:hypothetical protein